MKTRILLIDDDSSWSQEHCAKISEDLQKNGFEEAETIWLNPHDFEEDDALLVAIGSAAKNDRWDAILIDVNLARKISGVPALILPFEILTAFRKGNKAALAMVYSGTMRKHLRTLFTEVGDDDKHPYRHRVEDHLRDIFADQGTSFYSRDDLVAEVVGEMRNPPLLLRVERMLEIHKLQVVGPQEAEFKGLAFEELARAVREQSALGQRIVSLVVEYGAAALIDLNT